MDWELYLRAALEAVKAGHQVLEAHKLQGFELKADKSPVTVADKLVEQTIREVIIPKFPECGFVGEEFDSVNPTADLVWYCDPIDGTWSYLNGEKTCSLILSLFQKGTPKVSVVYNIYTGELYSACEGKQPVMNEYPLPRRTVDNLSLSLVNFHISSIYSPFIKQLYDWWSEEKFSKLISQGGSIAYAFARVAEGIHHVCISKGTKNSQIWDLGAGIHLIESAGGVVTNLQGEKFYECKKGEVIVASANPKVHKEVLKLLNSDK
jgi:fructose-1,6-bisphosphatase/inositol monophosphatase family enzyme